MIDLVDSRRTGETMAGIFMMIRRATIRNFKRFHEQAFSLADLVALVRPNNTGNTTLLQAIAAWKFSLDWWVAQRACGRAVSRPGIAIPCRDINVTGTASSDIQRRYFHDL